MINQQLISFIRQQLQLGTTKEKISSELLANGWSSQDVEEGFKAVDIPVPTPNTNPTPVSNSSSFNNNLFSASSTKLVNHSGNKIFLVALIIFLLLTGGASAYYFKDTLLNLPVIKDLVGNNDVIKDVMTPEVTQVPTEPINCPNDDLSCFIDAAKNCSRATVVWNASMTMAGKQNARLKLDLNGFDSSGKCAFSNLIEDVSINFTPEMKLEAKNSGMTDAAIEQTIKTTNELIKPIIGTVIKCSFSTSELIQKLTNWSVGTLNSDDLTSNDCTTNNSMVKLYTKPSTTLPVKITAPLDISTWKTYKNTEYGFQFKYQPSDPAPTVRIIDPLEKGQDKVVSISIGSYTLSITGIYDSVLKRNMTMDELLKSFYMSSSTKEDVIINDIKAVRTSKDYNSTSFHSVEVYIPRSSTQFIIISYGWILNNDNSVNKNKDIYESMVASFKFIK
ncbi:MAG: hypothetical protein WCS86_02525 [Candidatus Paceibacterota bacterium]